MRPLLPSRLLPRLLRVLHAACSALLILCAVFVGAAYALQNHHSYKEELISLDWPRPKKRNQVVKIPLVLHEFPRGAMKTRSLDI